MSRDANLVVRGRIATLADERGWGWVEAVAIGDGRVLAAGSSEDIDGLTGPRTQRLELAADEVAIPGLTDAHLHLGDAAREAGELDLATCPSLEQGLTRIAERHRVLPARAWLEGSGWSADRWGGWPTSAQLAVVAPGRRVAIWQSDHHALWCSAESLAVGRVGPGTPDPSGGRIRREADGRPTGVLMERAVELVTSRIEPPSPDALVAGITSTASILHALGVVAVHDPGSLSPDPALERAFPLYARLADAGRLPIRVHASIREDALPTAIERGLRSGVPLVSAPGAATGETVTRARMGWLKLFADGTLGSRTAAVLDAYETEAGSPPEAEGRHGMLLTEPDALLVMVNRAAEAGIASQVHAIGDRAVRVALEALEPAASQTTLRPRVEHVQLVDRTDLPRFARAGIAASVQPGHLAGDATAARTAWGSRAERDGYPWGSLASGGALIPFGTDAPVEPLDPWPGIALAVCRADAGWGRDAPPFGQHEALSLDRVIRAACLDGPLSAGETDRGRLEAGYRADLIVLPAMALREPVEPGGPLGTARPRRVLIGGRVAFEA